MESNNTGTTKKERALKMVLEADGPLSVADFRRAGIAQSTVRSLVLEGAIESPTSGVFVRPGLHVSEFAEWAVVSFKSPHSVVCLLSAAAFHGMTQELPGRLSVAIPHGKTMPKIEGIGVELDILVWRKPEMFDLGIDVRRIDGVDIQITSPERTLVDLFRYSSLNSGMRAGSVRITDEMFLESLERCHCGTIEHFSFVTVSAIARELCCYEALRPYTKTMRFRRADQPTL